MSEMVVMKKGPWSMAEDKVLVEYVTMNGEGNWNMVARNSELNRCGRSCRLRWLNHRRPGHKKEPFSTEEESIIVQLHAQIGNRWSLIAKKLPGRSDNEIKKFSNKRAKMLERAGLPLYPESLIQRNRRIHLDNQSYKNQISSPTESQFPNEDGTSTPIFVPPNSDPQNAEFISSPNLSMRPVSFIVTKNPNPPSFTGLTNPIPSLPNSSFPDYSYSICDNGRNFSLDSVSYYPTFSSVSFSSTIPNPNNQTFMSHEYPVELQFSNLSLHPNSFEPQRFFSTNYGENSSSHSVLDPLASCGSSNAAGLINFSNFNHPQYYSEHVYTTDGLLEDISGAPKSCVSNDNLSYQGKEICMWDSDCGSSSLNTATGMQICEPIKEMSPMDDKLSSLLEKFSMEDVSTEWY